MPPLPRRLTFAGTLMVSSLLAVNGPLCAAPGEASPAKATRNNPSPGPMVTLAQQGQVKAVIFLGEGAPTEERLAAEELQNFLGKISGGQVPMTRIAPAGWPQEGQLARQRQLVPIFLGGALLPEDKKARLATAQDDAASFLLSVSPTAIHIAGKGAQGTLNGSYELLEQLGVRWFMPGEIGTVIPSTPDASLAAQETLQVPSFAARWHGGSKFPEWARRMRMGGPQAPPSHGIIGTTAKDFPEHPEWFALIKGVRSPKAKQLCTSNPEVVQRTIAATKAHFRKYPDTPWIGMGPNDGGGFCECANCRALDSGETDPFVNEPSLTDRYIWFFNQVLEGIKDEFPEKKVSFYSYHTYMRPPLKVKPNPLIVPQLAPITLCRVHGLNNPVCPERSYYRYLIEGWSKVSPQVYDRGYWFNLADPGLPFSEVHKLRDEIPAFHQYGIKGWRVETLNHWGSETPSLYVAAKLMWNHEANVDALLTDFYQKFFGPAQAPMAAYFTLMDAALRDADHHTGSAFNALHFYPRQLRVKAREHLDAAAKLAGDGIFSRRVAIFRSTFEYLETFNTMLEQRDALDFAGAHASLASLDAQRKELVSYDPPLVNARAGEPYLKRFFRQPVEQGYARTTGGNELVAGLKDVWDFQLDQQRLGEEIGLWKPGATGGNWKHIHAVSRTWSDEGLRAYKGEAWYRQSVDIPAKFEGKRVFLWFGGVDEKAKVWVNGQPVGISHGSAFLPFELDATQALLPGKTNVVTVRLVNDRLDELGTGGITAPVMFYAPAAGANAVLDNSRELQLTFP